MLCCAPAPADLASRPADEPAPLPASFHLATDGHVVADGTTYDVLTDADLMRAHRLELPVGFHPGAIDSLPG